jgi:signal transduction histidine kinase
MSIQDAAPDPSRGSRPEEFPAAGVVHDLGNLIQIAASAVNIVARNTRAGRDPALEPVLARAKTALERAGALVHQAVRRSSEPAFLVRAMPNLQDIALCLSEIQLLISWICEPDIALSLDIEPGLPPIRCNRIELQNAILNLVINARDALPDGGSIRIAARRVMGGQDEVLALSVGDDGTGMSRETLLSAFSPYFTTKGDGRGTGLGLAMVKRFAHDADGRIDIASTLGVGTTVTLQLPAASDGI